MSTRVRHGPNPDFGELILGGRYSLTVTGHYTNVPDLAAAGVSSLNYSSDRPEKRKAELLAMRTAFLEMFVEEWVKLGGTREQAVYHVAAYPFWRVRERVEVQAP